MTQNEQVYAIFCRPEVARDVISGPDVIEAYVAANIEVSSSVRYIKQDAHKFWV